MKILKRILSAAVSAVCTLTMCIDLFPQMETEVRADYFENITYRYCSDHYEVEDCDHSVTNVVIPKTFNGLPVTAILDLAFVGCNELVSVQLPSTITSIGANAFNNCESLRYINIPDEVTEIGGAAFSGTPILDEQPSGVRYIGKWAIAYNGREKEVEIKDGTIGLASSCFSYSEIENVYLPNSLKYIGESICFYCENLKSISLPYGIEHIGDSSFENCDSLEKVSLPISLKSMGAYCFSFCDALTDVEIPRSVTQLGEKCFVGVPERNGQTGPAYYLDGWGLYTDSETEEDIIVPDGTIGLAKYFLYIRNVDCVKLPEGLKYIGENALSDLPLTSLDIPDSVEKIGIGAFSKSSMTSINLPDKITELSAHSLYRLPIDKIKLPESLTKIGSYALGGTNLKRIVIPEKVTFIDSWAFESSDELTDVYIRNPEYNWADYYGYYDYTFHVDYNSVSIPYFEEQKYRYYILGDVNADRTLNLYDIIGICKHFMNMETLSGGNLINADYNGDEAINLYDAVDAAKRIMNA